MTRSEFAALAEAVQVNCHIADARHAADLSMCIYLLQMREFYRWEQGIGPLQSLPHDQLGAWLAGREALWQSLEGRDYEPLSIAGQALEPFDMVGINSRLQGQGLGMQR